MFGYDAPHWHAVLNDLPAALLLVAVLFDVGAAATKRESLMWAGIWTLWAGVIGGWAAVVAGKLASSSIQHGPAIHEIMEKHENMALLTMGLFTVVLAWRLFRRFQMPAQELAFTRMLSVVGLLGLVWTGVLGGRLMFQHAAGIPTRTLQAEIENRELWHEHEPGEEDEHEDEAADSTKTDTTKTDTTKAKTTAPHTHPPGTPPHSH
jgi:uncharacterized membrane protein